MLVVRVAAIATPIIASIGDVISLIRAYTVGHRWFVTDSHFRNPLLLFMGTVLASLRF